MGRLNSFNKVAYLGFDNINVYYNGDVEPIEFTSLFTHEIIPVTEKPLIGKKLFFFNDFIIFKNMF